MHTCIVGSQSSFPSQVLHFRRYGTWHMALGTWLLPQSPPAGCKGSGDLTPDDHDSLRVLHTLETGCYRAASSVKPELSPPQKVNLGVYAVSLVGFRGPIDKQRGSCLEENTALSLLAQVAR